MTKNPIVASEEDVEKLLNDFKEIDSIISDSFDDIQTLVVEPQLPEAPSIREEKIYIDAAPAAREVTWDNVDKEPNDSDTSSELEPEVLDDKDYAITNLKVITEKTLEALETLSGLAEDSQHPRAFEVIGQLATTVANIQKDILSIHKDRQKMEMNKIQTKKLKEAPKAGVPITREEANSNTVTNNTIVFTGSNSELDRMIAEKLTSLKNDNTSK